MWNEALREWNAARGGWRIPKKGTAEYEEVMAILNKKGGHPEKKAPAMKPPTEIHPGKESTQPEKPFKTWLLKHFEKHRF